MARVHHLRTRTHQLAQREQDDCSANERHGDSGIDGNGWATGCEPDSVENQRTGEERQ